MTPEIALNPELATISRIIVLVALTFYAFSFIVLAWALTKRAGGKGKKDAFANRLDTIGLALMGLGVLANGVGVLTRGIAANRVPWANMYEFSISGAFVVSAIFLLVLIFRDLKFIAPFVVGFVVLVIGSANTLFYVQVESLVPALQDYWLVIHVSVAILATAFFTIGATLSLIHILKETKRIKDSKSKAGKAFTKLLKVFP